MTYWTRVLLAFAGGALFVGGALAAVQLLARGELDESGGLQAAIAASGAGFGLVCAARIRPGD